MTRALPLDRAEGTAKTPNIDFAWFVPPPPPP